MKHKFFISDTHFGHSKIYEGEQARVWANNREDGDQYMIDKWNSVVKSNDTVYHLGDVAFPKKSLEILSKLHGQKILIRGNHDIYPLEEYAKYFKDIRGAYSFENIMFTHIPIYSGEKKRWKFNVHGHLHNKVVGDPFYKNVCVEQIDATPVHFDELINL
tara:strand:+ start:131 stop:610 length:480 start_codon:yes stop_codon:yes gene_type:complete